MAILARVWLIVHTQDVIAGDEALVGIQAEHILRGERPVYYYSQPYLGSLQTYIIAVIFLFTGPAVWAMRIEPLLISLVIVYITWRFSAALADAAHLSVRSKKLFMVIATLVAAFAPLYDVVEEMRVTGGYDDAIAVMVWLLYCAFRLTQRWSESATGRELLLRWVGLGVLAGMGLWIDPLVVYAYATVTLWIGGYFLYNLVGRRQPTGSVSLSQLLNHTVLSLAALPAFLVGFAPGLIWGAQNNWANVTYLFHNGTADSSESLRTVLRVGKIYAICLAPRALGGALPTQPGVTTTNPHIVTFGLVVVGASIAISVAGIGLSLYCPQVVFRRVRQLTLLPSLFLVCVSAIFCTAAISSGALVSGCGPWDLIGRYVVPLVVAFPFMVAAACCIPLMILQNRQQNRVQKIERQQPVYGTAPSQLPMLLLLQAGLVVVLALYVFVQGVAYLQASPNYTFQATGCPAENPTNLGPIISYMQRTNIHDVWAVGWVADPITFETNGAILATQPDGRIPANSRALLHADRASMLVLAAHADPHPAYLQVLDENRIAYHVERFYSVPGIDILLITPINRSVSPLDPAFSGLFQQVFGACI